MKYKHIEAAREARLWIRDIVVPGVMLATSTLAIPEVRQAVAAKANSIKENIERKIKKEKES